MTERFLQSAAWFWFLFRKDLHGYWLGKSIKLPAQPATSPAGDLLDCTNNFMKESHEAVGNLDIKIATANVLSLKAGSKKAEFDAWGPARQELLLQQFYDHKVQMFAMQETRIKKLWKCLDEKYIILKSAATARGHFGMAMCFSRTMPHGTVSYPDGSELKVFFTQQDLSIVAASPRYLIVRVKTAVLKCIALACHAPHSGASDEAREAYWDELREAIPQKYQDWDVVLMGDLNCRLGGEPSQAVGHFQAEDSNGKEHQCHDFLLAKGIQLPSTFAEFQAGEPGTWLHPNGWLRNDFVGIPQRWRPVVCKSWVEQDIDLALKKTDHCVATLALQLVFPIYHTRRKEVNRIHECDLEHLDGSFFWNLPQIEADWSMDVHTHAEVIQQNIYQSLLAFKKRRKKIKSSPRKTTLSEGTWDLVCQKKKARTYVTDLSSQQRTTLLAVCFCAWAGSDSNELQNFGKILADQDRVIAVGLSEFRRLGREVTRAVRRDDSNFYHSLSEEATLFLDPQQSKKFWQIIRRSLPQLQARRLGYSPHQLECLEEQWNPHFQSLEAGTDVDVAGLIQDCHNYQTSRKAPEVIRIGSLPTLAEVEDVFRDTKANKSTGLDPIPSGLFHNWAPSAATYYFDLVWKMFVWRSEPVSFKGGNLAVIPKKGDLSQAKNYRGILLLPSVPKRIHALIRKRIVAKLDGVRYSGQIGGFPKQQVMFGSQIIRSFTNVLAAHGHSTAVLFVDLAEAFHRLVRELITGIGIPHHVDFLLRHLEDDGLSTEGLRECLEQPNVLYQLDCDPLIQELAQDIHYHTWYKIGDRPITRTTRGTRPGSPLADIIFHCIMHDIHKDLAEWIADQRTFTNLCSAAGVQPLQVIWSDDLAIPWATEHPEDLHKEVANLLAFVKATFQRRGFKLNLAKNKTSVVATMQGPGAPHIRRRLYLAGNGGHAITFDDEPEQWLHYLPAYKHLGSYYTADRTLDFEVRCRIGTARSAFVSIAKQVLCNRRLPMTTRFRLFSSLIESKLYFGCGAWITPPAALLKKLRGAVVAMCRRIGGWHDYNDGRTQAQILSLAGIRDPRIVIAVERLRYAMRIFRDGPTNLFPLLEAEGAIVSHSWKSGFEADLTWLASVGAEPDEVPTTFDAVRDLCRSHPKQWIRLIKSGLKRYRLQEQTMQEAHMFHRQILRALNDAGAGWNVDPFAANQQDPLWKCACGRAFSTPQGLSSHRRKVHGIFSLEHGFLAGATCPSCHKYLWTTQRLQQHLAYVPRGSGINKCYHDLKERGYQTQYEPVGRPTQLRGLNRADCLDTFGPFLPMDTQQDDARNTYQTELDTLKEEHVERSRFNLGEPPATFLYSALGRVTQEWFEEYQRQGDPGSIHPPLDERWIDTLEDMALHNAEFAMGAFLHWGGHDFKEVTAQWEDGQAEAIAEEHFYQFASQLPRFEREARILTLERLIKGTHDSPEERKPHRPVRRGNANQQERQETREMIPSLFLSQTDWQHELRQLEWVNLMPESQVPSIRELRAKPHFLVVHLFSGRRRRGDVHHRLQDWADRRDCNITVLSLDTANSLWYGNLHHESTTWTKLIDLYSQGCIAATISGSPCETFSAARAQPPPPDMDGSIKWPRPLRSYVRLFGLDHLTFKEIRQLGCGTAFFLQTAVALTYQLIYGGYAISEHPAEPVDPGLPSIWRSAILQLLLKHPRVSLHRVAQWRCGASVRKPTGLLAIRLNGFARSMYSRTSPEAVLPTDIAIGKDTNGAFKTAAHKEYPEAFCGAIAGTIADHLEGDMRKGTIRVQEPGSDLEQWIREAVLATSQISARSFLPDYQGR